MFLFVLIYEKQGFCIHLLSAIIAKFLFENMESHNDGCAGFKYKNRNALNRTFEIEFFTSVKSFQEVADKASAYENALKHFLHEIHEIRQVFTTLC